jgi:nucleoside-diphosphate-sugar epimerase
MGKILITGATGFIGNALVKELSDRGNEIVAVVRDTEKAGERFGRFVNVTIVGCDMKRIAELPSLLPEADYDACFHLAWAGSSGTERADYELQLENVRQTLNMVDVSSRLKVKRFVGVGTLAEMDIENYLPHDGVSPSPVSMYGIAKRMAHYMVKTQCVKHGMEYIWCMLSNTYGVGNTTNNFVNMACNKMLKGERAAFTSGEQMYDFLYITDAAKAMADAAQYGKNGTDYFLGSTKPRELKNYIQMIRDAIDPGIPLYLGEVPFNGNALGEEAFSTEKLERDTPYVSQIPFEEGICRTVAWLRERNSNAT